MYHFPYFLPFLPTDYRRKLFCSLLVTYHELQAEENERDSSLFYSVSNMFHHAQDYELGKLEKLGKTNTNGNPFRH